MNEDRYFIVTTVQPTQTGEARVSLMIETSGKHPSFDFIQNGVNKLLINKREKPVGECIILNIYEFKSEQDWKDYLNGNNT